LFKAFEVALEDFRKSEDYAKFQDIFDDCTWTSRGALFEDDYKVIKAIAETGDLPVQRILVAGAVALEGLSPDQVSNLIQMNSLVVGPLVYTTHELVWLRRFVPAKVHGYLPEDLMERLWKAESERLFGPGALVPKFSNDFYESVMTYWVGEYRDTIFPVPEDPSMKKETLTLAAMMLLARPELEAGAADALFCCSKKPLPKLFKFRYLTDIEATRVKVCVEETMVKDDLSPADWRFLEDLFEANKAVCDQNGKIDPAGTA
jgi:hypothetical protein